MVAADDTFSQANVGRTSAEATEAIDEIVAIAHDGPVTVEVVIATAWDSPFEGPTPPQRVLEIAAPRANAAPTACRSPTPSAPPPRAA